MVSKYTGQKAHVWIDSGNNEVVSSGSTIAGQKYFVMDKGGDSAIPVPAGMIFQAPRTNPQIALVDGDRIYHINEERFCKTSASFELGQDAVDVGDDCHPASTIASGITTFSGSLSGLFRYDPVTDEFENIIQDILNKFMTVVHDDGEGTYEVHPKDDAQVYILTQLNSGAKSGQFENYIFAPIVINSMSMSFGHADPQSKDISFNLGHGSPIIYRVPSVS